MNIPQNQSDATTSTASGGQDPLAESLSALMDNEAGELELRRLLRAVGKRGSEGDSEGDSEGRGEGPGEGSDALLARWRRYHLVQASLHNAQGPRIRTDLLPGIQARLEAEGHGQMHGAGLGRRGRGLVSRLGQGAVAASVAALVLFAATQADQHLRDSLDSEAGAGQAGSLVADGAAFSEAPLLPELGGEYSPSSLTRTVSMGAAERDRIQRAVQQFSGQAPAVLFNEVYTFPVPTESGDPEAAGQ